jgi:hypothetical protein
MKPTVGETAWGVFLVILLIVYIVTSALKMLGVL